MSNAISIKGTRDGLTITMATGDFGRLIEDLGSHLKMQGQFFRGGKVALRLGGRLVAKEELERVAALLESNQMVLRTILTSDEQTAAAAQEMGLHVVTEEGTPEPAAAVSQALPAEPVAPVEPAEPAEPDEETAALPSAQTAAPEPLAVPPAAPALEEQPLAEPPAPRAPAVAPAARLQTSDADGERAFFLRRNVRSGQVVRHTGSVVIVGDVNPGAEIWATGDVIVWGRLRGTVRAGSSGNADAVICALEMHPLQLRIGDCIARPDDADRKGRPYPEIARVRDGAVVVEPWTAGRGV